MPPPSPTLEVEETAVSETFVPIYKTTRRNILEWSNFLIISVALVSKTRGFLAWNKPATTIGPFYSRTLREIREIPVQAA
jgi:hypothetical protein